MNDDLRDRLLGSDRPDPGCDACFELLDQYAELIARGADPVELFPEVVAHLESCPDCREDTEGMVALLRSRAPRDEGA